MKEAMWGLGLIMLCLLVFVIVGVISNISLTNQQDYYGVKQTTEASAYDAVEMVEYKSGVCLCTNTTPNSSGTRVFSSTVEYALKDVDKETNTCPEDPNYSHCDLLLGEYIIDPDVFTESVIARLGSIIKPSEIYDIINDEDISEYVPNSVNRFLDANAYKAIYMNKGKANATSIVEELEQYSVSDLEYNINGIIISKPKVLRNFTILEQDPGCSELSRYQKIFNAIIYGSVLDEQSINMISNVFGTPGQKLAKK